MSSSDEDEARPRLGLGAAKKRKADAYLGVFGDDDDEAPLAVDNDFGDDDDEDMLGPASPQFPPPPLRPRASSSPIMTG